MAYGWRNAGGYAQEEPLPLWYNPRRHEIVKIGGNQDAGIYYVEKSLPIPSLHSGSVRISPTFVDLNRKPVGQRATRQRADAMASHDWRQGTYADALNYVLVYQKANPGV